MSTIHIKVKQDEDLAICVSNLKASDVFTLKECKLGKIYMLADISRSCKPAVAVNLGTGELRTIAGDMVVGEKFSKVEIILTS